MDYIITTTNDNEQQITVTYQDVNVSSRGAFRLMKHICFETAAAMEMSNDKYHMSGSDFVLEWYWQRGTGLVIRFIKLPADINSHQFMLPFFAALNKADACKIVGEINDYL